LGDLFQDLLILNFLI